MKGALGHSLKVELTAQDRERLLAFMATLPEGKASPPFIESTQEEQVS
jgi:hypothetical protein